MLDTAEDELLDPRAVAAKCLVTERTVADWRRKGFGPPFVRVGGLYRYRTKDVRLWLERGGDR